MPAREPALIAAARSQMTASSPRGTFSQAELAADRVITRCITRSMPVPGATIRAKLRDLKRQGPQPPLPRRAGSALLAAEMLGRVRAGLPMIGELGSGSRSW